MTRKVSAYIFGTDLRAELKKVPLNSDESKLEIKSGGKAHNMPAIDAYSYLELPYRSLLTPWKVSYRRVYFVRRWAKKCVNFYTGEVTGPDPKQVIDAASNKILESKGKQTQEAKGVLYGILFVNLIILVLILKIAGVIN